MCRISILALRTGKVVKNKKDEHGMWNYSKLCFNTKYPWEAAVAPDIEAQQYVLYDGVSDEIKKGNVTYWHGLKNDVLYRRQFFNYDLEHECHWIQAMNLADFTVPPDTWLLWFPRQWNTDHRKDCRWCKGNHLKGA